MESGSKILISYNRLMLPIVTANVTLSQTFVTFYFSASFQTKSKQILSILYFRLLVTYLFLSFPYNKQQILQIQLY